MFLPPPSVRIFLCRQPTDMRKSFDSLAALVRDVVLSDPLSGHVFVFKNRGGDRMKVLWWDRSGFCLLYRRLEEGTYAFPEQKEISAGELAMILEGIDVRDATRRKRYILPQRLK